ncbi:MAG: DUF86 domain-containing protein [Nanoarchaeota archaeon]
MKRNENIFLKDILESISNIENFSRELTKKDFINSIEKQSATIRQIEIIGEAVKNISDLIKEKNSAVEWKKIAGMRDIIINQYFNINVEIIGDVIVNKSPKLKLEVQKIKNNLEEFS